MAEPLEISIQRANTRWFIAAKPSQIVLTPYVRSRVASGGWKYTAQDARDPQTFRIIEQSASGRAPQVTLTDGTQRAADFLLLGDIDVTVEIDDRWVLTDDAGRYWDVRDVVRSNGYEVRAWVVELGR